MVHVKPISNTFWGARPNFVKLKPVENRTFQVFPFNDTRRTHTSRRKMRCVRQCQRYICISSVAKEIGLNSICQKIVACRRTRNLEGERDVGVTRQGVHVWNVSRTKL